MSSEVRAVPHKLDNYFDEVTGIDESWCTARNTLVDKIEAFFNSAHDYGPSSSTLPADLSSLFNRVTVDAIGVRATAAAFRQADSDHAYNNSYEGPTDDEIEARRRSWLNENVPGIADEAAEATHSVEYVTERLEEIEAELADLDYIIAWAPADEITEARNQKLEVLREQGALAEDAIILLDELGRQIGDAHIPGSAEPPDHILDMFGERRALLEVLMGDDELAGHVLEYLVAGLPVRYALIEGEGEYHYEQRLRSVMEAMDVDEEEARALLRQMDEHTGDLMTEGASTADAMMAAEIMVTEAISLDRVIEVLRDPAFNFGAADAAATLVMADERDMTMMEFRAYIFLTTNYDEIAAASGDSDLLTGADLRTVAANDNDEYSADLVMAAQAILAEPQMFARLDDANDNPDILDSDSFGSGEIDDYKIGRHDLQAFEFKQAANTLLHPFGPGIDGNDDGTFSRGDYQDFLDNMPPELQGADRETARLVVEAILDGKMYDQGWLERHRDDLVRFAALGAGILAGVLVTALTAGTAAPAAAVFIGTLVAGFGAGAVVAGAGTGGINLITGNDIADGMAANMISGGFIGMGGAALPGASGAVRLASTTFGRTAAYLGIASDVTGVVGAGGVDIFIPEAIEGDVHGAAKVASVLTGGGALTMVGGRVVVRRFADENFTRFIDTTPVSTRLSIQKQARHVDGHTLHVRGGALQQSSDGQLVLDAFHRGEVRILGRTKQGDILIEYEGVTGLNNSGSFVNQPTNRFIIKGTTSPSVVPTSPAKVPHIQMVGTLTGVATQAGTGLVVTTGDLVTSDN